MFDIIIRNGTVVDGSGQPAVRADVAVQGDRIAAVGELSSAEAQRSIDADGRVVAPGLIDVHNHSDGWLRQTRHLLPKTRQGITTEVLMADGISYAPVNQATASSWLYYLRALNGLGVGDYDGWQSIADYLEPIDGRNVQNMATHVPYANARALACGFGREPVDDLQMKQIQMFIAQGMEQGAVGLSTGLDYIAQCFSTTEELVRACEPVAASSGLYVTHVRYKLGLVPALQEAVEIGKRAGVAVHISHLKATRGSEAEKVLQYIDRTATNEVDFSFDVYPYQSSSTMLNYLLPYEVWEQGPLAALEKLSQPKIRARFASALDTYRMDLTRMRIGWLPSQTNRHLLGQRLSAFVEQSGKLPADALADLLQDENMSVLLVLDEGDDDAVRPFIAHERCMLGSDGIYFEDAPVHPRVYGSGGRWLGRAVRDWKCFSLETAIHKASGLPAARFGLTERGLLQEGCFADLIVLDPDRVDDPATYTDSQQYCVGIETVVVNGVVILENESPVELDSDPLPGRFLKYRV